jgi:hypothetical protein
MSGRRRYARYVLSHPLEGNLHVREEVSIERWSDHEIVVLSPAPSRRAQNLTLELPGTRPRRLLVQVEGSSPVVAPDGSLRHRLRLVVLNGAGNDNGGRRP